ncbi:MAG: hypothetical protein WC306_03325 [Candidatus Paceibacterota bacterium]|jgi:hypothetical protein
MSRYYYNADFTSKEITKAQFNTYKQKLDKITDGEGDAIVLEDGTPLRKVLHLRYEDSRLQMVINEKDDVYYTGSRDDATKFNAYVEQAVDVVRDLVGSMMCTDSTSGFVEYYWLDRGYEELQMKEFENQDAFAEWQMEQPPI